MFVYIDCIKKIQAHFVKSACHFLANSISSALKSSANKKNITGEDDKLSSELGGFKKTSFFPFLSSETSQEKNYQ